MSKQLDSKRGYYAWSLQYLGFFFLLVASCTLLNVTIIHDSRVMSKWFGCSFVSLFMAITLFQCSKRKRTYIRTIDLAIVACLLYFIFSDYSRGDLNESVLLRIVSLGILYVFFRKYISGHTFNACFFVLLIVGVVVAVWGIVQFVLAIGHGQSPQTAVTGSFDNPAGFALTLALIFPIGIHFTIQSALSHHLRFVIYIALSFIVLALLLSCSRTGWISLLCTSVYAYVQCGRFKIHIIALSLFVIVLLLVIFYFFKQDSADGRSYITLCTWQQISDAPWWGHGRYGFSSGYMAYQAEYLSLHPDSRFAWLADNVHHPFNEWLYLIVRYGIVGLIVFVVGLLSLVPAIRYEVRSKNFLPLGMLIALFPFTLFSYPMQYPLSWVVLTISAAILAPRTIKVICISGIRITPIVSLLCACGTSLLLYRTLNAEMTWYDVAKRSLSGQTRHVMPQYAMLYNQLKDLPHFLYNYAAELNYIGEYSHSQQLLEECMLRMNGYDIHLLAADNYEHMGNYDLAEQYLLKASSMCPARFIPLYQLVRLYEKMEDYDAQQRMAQQIIDKEVKVPSRRVTEIKNEMRHIIEKPFFN